MIVADVNLVAYLLLGGPDTHVAQRVLERDPVWAAPVLWRSEFRSILSGYIRLRGLALNDAWQVHELAEALFSGNEFTVPGERVLQLVAGSPCSAYDCEYVALAQELGVPLLTAERQVLQSFPDVAVRPLEFLRT